MIESHPRFKPYGFVVDHKDPTTIGKLWAVLEEAAGTDVAINFMSCKGFGGAPILLWANNHVNGAKESFEGASMSECIESCILWCWDKSHIAPAAPTPKVKPEKKVPEPKKAPREPKPTVVEPPKPVGAPTESPVPSPAFKPLPPPRGLPKPHEVRPQAATILDMFT